MEHRAFANRMRRTPLSMAAQLLWYKLMDLANSLRWPEHFALDNSRLCTMINTTAKRTAISARQELIDGGYLDFTPGIKGRPSTYHLRSVEEMEGWQPPPDDLEGDFLAEFKEDPTSYFGYTEALGVELAETTAHLWAEFFPGKTPGPYDEKRTFFQIMVQHHDEETDEWSISFPEENKELLGYAFEQGRKRGKLFWGYIESVMRNLRDCGIKTVDEAYENEEKFYERRGWNK